MTDFPNNPVINPLHHKNTMAKTILDKAIDFVFLLLARHSSSELDSALASCVGLKPFPNSGDVLNFLLKRCASHSMRTTASMTIA